MAFPLASAHIISHLRSSYLVLFEDDNDARRLIKPNLEDPDGDIYKPIFDRLSLLSSPPIVLNSTAGGVGTDINYKPNRTNTRSSKLSRKRKNRIRHRKQSISSNTENNNNEVLDYPELTTPPNDDIPLESETNSLQYTKTIKPKPKKKGTLMRLFQNNNDSDSDSSTRVNEQEKTHLPDDGENNSGNSLHDHIAESTPLQDTHSPSDELSDKSSISVKSDFHGTAANVASSSHKRLVSHVSSLGSISETDDTSIPHERETSDFDDSDEDYDDEDEDDFDDDDDDDMDDGSSTESAFTDIETGSMMNSSLLLDSFDTTEFSYHKKSNALSSKMRKKKSRLNSFEHLNSSKTTNKMSKLSLNDTLTSSQPEITPIMKFEKVKPQPVTKDPQLSNLSSMIQSRSKSANSNPLNYYSFANDDSISGRTNKVELDVFVPPKTTPSLTNLSVNNNIAIVDCIGYILLHLSEHQEFKNLQDFNFLDPNHWRLELVDEDGENYGSFGILDRTRLLSSYNNPKELAICKVEDSKEVVKNEKQTPLPVELRQSLTAFRRKKLVDGFGSINTGGLDNSREIITLTVINTDGRKFTMDVDSHASIQEALYDFCAPRNLNPDNYKFRLIGRDEDKDTLSENSNNDVYTLRGSPTIYMNESKRLLTSNELIKELSTTVVQLVPAKIGPVKSLLNNNSIDISPVDNNISPSAKLDIITPPKNYSGLSNPGPNSSRQDSIQGMNKSATDNKTSGTNNITKFRKASAQDSNKIFDKMMIDMNSQIPNNSKTKYFTWKVWRKKTTILNKIEKSLIIDGDYIRLQPPEDRAYTKDPNDNPFLASQGGHSHHHHLHHYNYSNYYNGSMMKTSSFHITQVVKLKQYKNSKNPNHFKIVIEKPGKDSTAIKKKYDLEAVSEAECEAIIDKIKWVSKLYNAEMANIK